MSHIRKASDKGYLMNMHMHRHTLMHRGIHQMLCIVMCDNAIPLAFARESERVKTKAVQMAIG